MTSHIEDEEDVPAFESRAYKDFQKQMEKEKADYKAISRAGALLLLLKVKDRNYQKYEIMRGGADAGVPMYAVRKVGLFGSKPVPGFTRGRMIEVEGQIRTACEKILGPISDADIDLLVKRIDLAPIANEEVIKQIKSL